MTAPRPRNRAITNALAIAAVELRRFSRDRSNIFFVLIFPLLLVVMIGAQFGEGANSGHVIVSGVQGQLHGDLTAELEDQGLKVSEQEWDGARDQLARGRADVAVRVDPGAEQAHESGRPVELEMVRGSSATAQVAEQRVSTAVRAMQARRGQLQALVANGVEEDRARSAIADAHEDVSAPVLEVGTTDELSEQFAGLGQFDLGASGQLLLFVFLTTLAGASTLIQARRERVITRILAAPVSTAQVIGGEVLGRAAIGLFQGGYIMIATSLLFGVSWGNIALSLLVLVVFSLVAAGAAMLLGAVLGNEGTAVGAGVGLGLILAALGGSMMPLELFPDTMRSVANLTPHAWAYEAFAEIQRRDGTLVDILPQLGVLAAMAAALLLLGAWALRRSLSRAV